MELLQHLALGFDTALSPVNILYCFVGCLLGTLVGVLPGIGPTATIAMLLPITFKFQPVTALIMLSGIYYGAQYGGSTTAILINLPGESSSAVTAIDGYQMAKKGRAGPALATAALGSFFAGSVATLILAMFAPPLASVALSFGAPEYFSLIVLGLLVSISLAHGSVLKALAMIVLGLLLGMVGQDIYTGQPRFTFGISELYNGISFVSMAVGVIRGRGNPPQPGIRKDARGHDQEGEELVADQGGLPAHHRPGPAGDGPRFDPGHPAGGRPRAVVLRLLLAREAVCQESGGVRARRHRRRGRPRIGQQTPPPRPRSSRSSPSASRPIR